MIPEKISLIEPFYTAKPDDEVDPVVLHHINVKKSPREWLRDPSFAESMLYDPADATITGNGANSYIRAKNRVQNFRLGEPRRSQEEYQRLMHKGKISADEGDRLHYLINVLDGKWQNALRGYKGDGTDPSYKRNYEKYIKQRQILEDNYNNWLQARQVRSQSWGQLRNPLFMVPGAMGETWSENIGTPIREWWDSVDFPGLQDMIIGGAVAENTPVMTASGVSIGSNGKVNLYNQDDPGVVYLRDKALPTVGTSAIVGLAVPSVAPHIPEMTVAGMGGEVVNQVSQKMGYPDFGHMAADAVGLEGNQTAIDVLNFFNPGYSLPSGQAARWLGQFVDDGVRTAYNTAKTITTKTVPEAAANLKTVGVRSPVYVTEEVVAPVTSSGVMQTPERFASSRLGWRFPIHIKPSATPTSGSVPPVEGTAAKIEGAEYTFRKPPRDMVKRGVQVHPEHRRALRKNLRYDSPEFKDAFAAEARKHFDKTGEMVSRKNEEMLRERAYKRLERMSELRNNMRYGNYVDELGQTVTYTKEQMDDIAKELKNYITEGSYRDPFAQPLNWITHPVTNTLSPKPYGWDFNNPWWSWIEGKWPWMVAGGLTWWGRDILGEYLPEAVKYLYVRPDEEPEQTATPQGEESNPLDKDINQLDTVYVNKLNVQKQLNNVGK